MADPRTINLPGSGTATQQYELAPGLAQYVQSVYVEVDNTAGAAARPTLTLSEQSGVVIAKKRQGEAIPAAGSGSATWALRLTDEAASTGGDGIQFDVDNEGDWLRVDTSGSRPVSGNGIDLHTHGFPLNLQTDNAFYVTTPQAQESADVDWQIQAAQGGGGGTLKLDSSDAARLTGLGAVTVEGGSLSLFADTDGTNLDSQKAFDMHVRNGLSEWDMDDGLAIVSSGSITFQIGTGQVLEIENGLGQPIFRVDADGSLHGKTGKTLTFDL